MKNIAEKFPIFANVQNIYYTARQVYKRLFNSENFGSS